MLVIGFVFCVLVLWAGYYVWDSRKWILMCGKFYRDPWNIPGLGCATLCLQDDEARMDMLKRFGRTAIEQGGMASLWVGAKFYIVVSDANVAEIVLRTCLAKGESMQVAHEFFGNGSIFAPVPIWRPRRKVLAPTFSMKNLTQFMEVFSRQSSIMVEQLNGAVGKGTFSVWKYLTTYTMDSVCESTLGVMVNAQRLPDHPFLKAFEEHCLLAAARLLHPPLAQKLYKYLPAYKTYLKPIHCMWNFVDNIIKEKRRELGERVKSSQGNDEDDRTYPASRLKTFLELLIESSGGLSGFTNLELREETLVLVLAGTDTSAVGSAFTCLMLGRHPEIQEKVYEEIKKVLGDSGRPIVAADLPNLKYLEAVVKESMRLYPPVPVIVRNVEQNFQLPSGMTVVKDTDILINIWAIHRNPRYWGENAEEFRPERFIEAPLTHPAAYIPFSHGPRSCLGYQYAIMSMKTGMANLILHYRIRPAGPVPDKNAPLRVKYDVMMKHVDNFELQMEARN